MKIKHSVSSSHLQTMGDFFAKKALYEETNFLRQIYGGKSHRDKQSDHARGEENFHKCIFQ